MKAIVKSANAVACIDHPMPQMSGDGDVLVRVMMAGLCRTDMYMARREWGGSKPLVLGHEFSGIVEEIGKKVPHVKPGMRVGILPLSDSDEGRHVTLGVDRDGAFAEYICVPGDWVFPIPDHVNFMQAAYLEPVAASLAPLQALRGTQGKGLVYGDNRIAGLTARILKLGGYSDIETCTPESAAALLPNTYDFIVETLATSESFTRMLDLIKPCGTLVLKSRPMDACLLPTAKIVQKELRVIGANYGSFEEAIEWLGSGKLKVDDFFGEVYSLEEGAAILRGERTVDETKKIFFKP